MTLYLGDDDAPPFPWPPPTDHVPAALRPDIFADGYVPVRAPDHDSTPGVYVEAIMGGTRCHVAWRECRRPEIERVTRPLPRVLNVDLTHPLGRYALARALGSFWALPRGDGGQLPDDLARWSSHLLACAAWRRVAGMGALRGALGPWRNPRWSPDVWMREYAGATGNDNAALVVDEEGWMMQPRGGIFSRSTVPYGPEISIAGRDAADRAATEAGYALLGDTLVLPWPAARPEVTP